MFCVGLEVGIENFGLVVGVLFEMCELLVVDVFECKFDGLECGVCDIECVEWCLIVDCDG